MFQFCDIKSSAPLLKYLSDMIGEGRSACPHMTHHPQPTSPSIYPPSSTAPLANTSTPDCTPKAVSHRLQNIKKTGKGNNATGDSATFTPVKGTSGKTATPKTPASGGRGQARPPKTKTLVNPDEVDNDEAMSPSVIRKRGRKPNKTVKEDEGMDDDQEEALLTKKIKMEPGEMENMLLGVGSQFDDYDGNMHADEEV